MTSHHQPSNIVKFPPIGECDDDLWAMPATQAALPPSGLSRYASQAKPAPAIAFDTTADESECVEDMAIAWGDVLFGAACGLLVGMLATVGLAYVWSFFL